ncbi:MAG: NUDIX hydrolase [Candidatus Saccharimonadales bacterium]
MQTLQIPTPLEIFGNKNRSLTYPVGDILQGDSQQVARVVVINEEGKILMCENSKRKWVLPGGKPDVDETLAETGARETDEETGAKVRVVGQPHLYEVRRMTGKGHYHNRLYVGFVMFAEHLAGDPEPLDETIAVGQFTVEDIEGLERVRADTLKALAVIGLR